jgi:hypothetical protein
LQLIALNFKKENKMKMNIPTFTAEASLDILAKIKYQGNISIGNTSSDNAVKMAMMSCFRCWIFGRDSR